MMTMWRFTVSWTVALLATMMTTTTITLATASVTATTEATVFRPVQFTVSELTNGHRQDDLRQALQTNGIISIVEEEDNDREDENKRGTTPPVTQQALAQWCQCYNDNQSNNDLTTLIPSTQVIQLEQQQQQQQLPKTQRTTLASATVGHDLPLALDAALGTVCGTSTLDIMEDLRDDMNQVSTAFVQALDQLLVVQPTHTPSAPLLYDVHGKSYPTWTSIVQAATHLEHYHIYQKAKETKQRTHTQSPPADIPKTLDFHTDAGLFLAFVPGYDCHASSASSTTPSFWIQDAVSGQELPVVFDTPPNRHTKAVIMLGAGAEQWLSLPLSSLKATQHAVQIYPGQTRAWFGKMHLVPDSAIVQTVPTTRTFKDLKDAITTTSIALATGRQDTGTAQRLASPSLGCGDVPIPTNAVLPETAPATTSHGRRRRLQHVGSPSDCNNVTNFFCWYQCLEIPNANQIEGYLNEGYNLYCLDPAVLAASGNQVSAAVAPCEEGYVHNGACQGSWQPAAPGVPTTVSFAHHNHNANAPIDLEFCYGGVSMYMDGFHWVHDSLCVIYLFPTWVLSSRTKLAMASVGTLFMGIVLEGVIWQRRHLLRHMTAGRFRLGTTALFYGLQLTIGYFVMLIVMTYSGVLFLCCIVGLVLGNILFNAQDGIRLGERMLVTLTSSTKRKRKSSDGQDEDNNDDDDEEKMGNKEYHLPHTCHCDAAKTVTATGGDEDDHDLDILDGATPCCQHGP